MILLLSTLTILLFTSLISFRLAKVFQKMNKTLKNPKCKVFSSILYTTNKMFLLINSTMFVALLFMSIKYPERLPLITSFSLYFFIALMFLLERILFWYLVEVKNGWH